jgi:hypothetical protein
MTVHRKIVKLRMTHAEAERYVPGRGIDVLWLEWDHNAGTVIAEFISCDKNPDIRLRKNMTNIGIEVMSRKVEDIASHPKSPPIAHALLQVVTDLYPSNVAKFKRLDAAIDDQNNAVTVGVIDEG